MSQHSTYSVGHEQMNATVIILCLFCVCVCIRVWAVGRQSECAVQCTVKMPEGCVQPSFLENDFTSYECIRLNRMAVPTFCATSWHAHSVPQPAEPIFSIPSLSFSSPLVAYTGYLPVQKRIKTCSRMFIKAC